MTLSHHLYSLFICIYTYLYLYTTSRLLQFIDGHGWVHGQVDSIDPTSYRVAYENGLLEDYSDQEMDEIAKLAAVQVGTRLAVFWYEEDVYHHATVFKQRNEAKSVLIEYDDGAGREWLDLRRNKFYLLTISQNNNNNSFLEGDGETRERTEIGQASVKGATDGDCSRDPLLGRVATWSVEESDLSKAMRRPDQHNISARLRANEDDNDNDVDSSDDEMDMLTKENPSLSLIEIGTRVSLWWPDDAHYYVGTVTHLRRTNAKPFYIEYDDGEFEWIDLRQHRFHLLSAVQETSRRVAGDCPDTVEITDIRPNVHDELKIKPTEAKEGSGVEVKSEEVVIAEMNLDLEARLEAESEPELVESTEKGPQREVEPESRAEFAGKLISSSDRAGADIAKEFDNDQVENEALSELESDHDDGTRMAAQSDDETRIAAQSDDAILEDSEEESMKEENPDIALVDVGSRVGIWWPEDRRYYKGVIIDRRRAKKPLRLQYDDDDVKEWLNLREHRFRLLRERTARRLSAPTIAQADTMEHEREDFVVKTRRGVKRLKSRRVSSKSNADSDSDNMDNDSVETENVASLPKRWKAQILNSRRAASKPSSDIDNSDDEIIETSADVSRVRKRRRVEKLNSRRAALKASADTDNMDDERVERKRDPSLVPKRRNKRRAASKPSPETSPRSSLVTRPSKAPPRNSGRFSSNPSSETSPRVTRRKAQSPTDYADVQRRGRSLDTDNVDEERVEASPDVSLVSVGLRVAVWWPEDQKYYNGTVTETRIGEKPFYLEYDDGEEEWINFLNHRFRLLRDDKRRSKILVEVETEKDCSDVGATAAEARPDVSAVTVGSRVAVWWPTDRRHYKGIVTKKRQGKAPFFLEYDDGEKEWINFSNHSFRLLAETKLQQAERRKKRREFMSELSNSPTAGRSKSSKNDLQVELGSRVAVFWPDDRKYYEGTVTRQRNKKNPFFLEYDDGEKEWIDFREHRVRLLAKIPVNVEDRDFGEERPSKQRRTDSSGSLTPSCVLRCGTSDTAKVEVGTRLSVWWSGDKEFFDGTVTRMRNTDRSKKPFYVEYDDGDREWIDLALQTFRLLEVSGGDPETSIDNKDTTSRQGAAPSEKKSRSKMAAKKKADLNESNLDEESSKEVLTSSLVPPESLSNGRSIQLKGTDEGVSCDTRSEGCHLCKSSLLTKPRATECHHLFCESCIHEQFERLPKCPVCNFRFGESLRLYSESDAPTPFRSIERIDMISGEVREVYPSASAASREVPGAYLATRILDACQTKLKNGREYAGSFWRFFGAKDRILRADECVTDGIPIEQVDLETNEVVETFPSSRQADERTGVSRCSIRRVLDRRGKARAGGFFWRFKGETNTPWQDPEPRCSTAVEKLCLESGDVLDIFDSLADAKRSMGMKPNNACIRDTCDGKGRHSALGFFWRWRGSNIYPSQLVGYRKTVQVQRSKNGPVVREFSNATKAAEWLGLDNSTVSRWCRDRSYNRECYWSYAFAPEDPEEEKLVGKRLRIRRNGNSEWLLGKVHAFNRETGKFTILFDFGECDEDIDLKTATFQWTNDQGQKRVEQISETGQVRNTYDSITDAARDLGIPVSAISSVLTGRSITCHGFFWRYHGSDAVPPKRRAQRAINQLCLKTGRVLATHKSIHEAAKTVGITSPGISYCCNGRNGSKSAGGFGWEFVSE